MKCQHPGCDHELRRERGTGNLIHVTETGAYIYVAHRPVPPPPKITRVSHADVVRARARAEARRNSR